MVVASAAIPPASAGALLLLRFRSGAHIASTDVFAYAEEALGTEISDVMIVRNERLQPTGHVYVHTANEVAETQLRALRTYYFRGRPVDARIFGSPRECRAAVEAVARAKGAAVARAGDGAAVVFARAGSAEVRERAIAALRSCGGADEGECGGGAAALRFARAAEAFRAAGIARRAAAGAEIGVVAERNSRRAVALRNVRAPEEALASVAQFGDVAASRCVGDTLYVRFRRLRDAQVAKAFAKCNFTAFSDF